MQTTASAEGSIRMTHGRADALLDDATVIIASFRGVTVASLRPEKVSASRRV